MDYVGLDWWPDKGVYEAYAFGRSGSTLIFTPLASKYQIRVRNPLPSSSVLFICTLFFYLLFFIFVGYIKKCNE